MQDKYGTFKGSGTKCVTLAAKCFASAVAQDNVLLRSFFSGLLHTLSLLWKTMTYETNARQLKNDLVYLGSVNCMLFCINVAVEPCK